MLDCVPQLSDIFGILSVIRGFIVILPAGGILEISEYRIILTVRQLVQGSQTIQFTAGKLIHHDSPSLRVNLGHERIDDIRLLLFIRGLKALVGCKEPCQIGITLIRLGILKIKAEKGFKDLIIVYIASESPGLYGILLFEIILLGDVIHVSGPRILDPEALELGKLLQVVGIGDIKGVNGFSRQRVRHGSGGVNCKLYIKLPYLIVRHCRSRIHDIHKPFGIGDIKPFTARKLRLVVDGGLVSLAPAALRLCIKLVRHRIYMDQVGSHKKRGILYRMRRSILLVLYGRLLAEDSKGVPKEEGGSSDYHKNYRDKL